MVAQVITIVNQSGKVVKTSKHLVNVWKEAKSAYDERKAEIKATRKTEQDNRERDIQAIKQCEALRLEDDDRASRASSRRSSRSRRDETRSMVSTKRKPVPASKTERPPVERGVSDSFYANDAPSHRSHRPSHLRQGSWQDDEPRIGELARRHTTDLESTSRRSRHHPTTPNRSASLDDIDMDLAYGELPPPLPERKYDTEVELRMKMSGLQRLLDEANCIQHSATATIDNLQKNPDALAAVALALAEVSNLAAKLAPGALTTLKGSFPAIVALLASPQFAIAAGVSVGVTIIALGGYKIIKKIKAQKEEARLLEDGMVYAELPPLQGPEPAPEDADSMDELREIDKIEHWRRGIAEAEASSLGTSVDGEFLTPVATMTLIEDGEITEADLKSTTSSRRHRKKSSGRSGSGIKPGASRERVRFRLLRGRRRRRERRR
ncbi:hypothetical protein EJ03DRAFT_16440 [Teratosphaeria nubilosa]|uniref:Uncharacterized protein n=1 Tax=Teratosphaeria nubilosa TaxID=161662 RepID=A0A6G1KVS5_9PEZI|nr:hypothetical protein EJ03DRAFT_16440 [Teratosphaeria nubilosa]